MLIKGLIVGGTRGVRFNMDQIPELHQLPALSDPTIAVIATDAAGHPDDAPHYRLVNKLKLMMTAPTCTDLTVK